MSAPSQIRPASMDESVDGAVVVQGRDRTWLHLSAIAAVLVLVMVWLGPGRFTIDEAAYLVQAEAVADGSFLLDYPTDEVMDQNVVAPLALSQTFESGWTPYSRHPLYPILLSWAQSVSQQYGAVLLSIAGTLLAAFGIGRIRQWLDGGSPFMAMWPAALLSPLAFHSQVVWAHSLSAGLVAVAVAWALQAATAHRWPLHTMGAGLALGAAAFLRTEAPFAALALVILLWLVPEISRQRWAMMSGWVAATIVAATLIDRWWARSVVDARPTRLPSADSSDGSLVTDQATGVANLLLSVGGGGVRAGLWLVVPILLVLALAKSRQAEPDTGMVRVLSVAAVLCAAVAVTATQSLSGWLPATPLAGVGLAASIGHRRARPLLVFVVVFGAFVVGTVPASGGGLGWGGRYLLVSLPVVVAVVVVSLHRLWANDLGRVIVGAGLAATALVQVNGLNALHRNHAASVAVEMHLDGVLTAFGPGEVIIAPDIRIGRTAPTTAAERSLLSPSDPAQLPFVLEIARLEGVKDVVIIELLDHDVTEIPTGWVVTSEQDDGLVRTRRVALDG